MEGMFNSFLEFVAPAASNTQTSTVEYLRRDDPELLNEIRTTFDSYYTLLILPTGLRFPGRTYYPYNYPFFEAVEELESATLLAFSGYYKAALQHLRFFLEMGVLGLYFCQPLDESRVRKWLLGNDRTPSLRKMLNELEANTGVKNLEAHTGIILEEECYSAYDELSRFVHSRGGSAGGMSLRRSSRATLNPQGLRLWSNHFRSVVRALALGFVSMFPVALQKLPLLSRTGFFYQPRGGYLEPEQVEIIERLFDSATLDRLRKFSDSLSPLGWPIDHQKLQNTAPLSLEQLAATWEDWWNVIRAADQGEIPGKTYRVRWDTSENWPTSDKPDLPANSVDRALRYGNHFKRQMDIMDEMMLADFYIQQLESEN